ESFGKRISTSVAEALGLVDGLAKRAAKFVVDLFTTADALEVEGGVQPEVPAYLTLADRASTVLALADRATAALQLTDRLAPPLILIDRPSTELTLSNAPTTILTLEDQPA